MNTLDILILVALGAGVVHGFTTGLIRQVTSVVGLILSFVMAARFMGSVADAASRLLGISEDLAPLVILVFILIQIIALALAKMVESVIGALKLTTVNRALGGAFGAVKAALVLSVLFLVLDYVNLPGDTIESKSSFYSPVAGLFPKAWDFASEKWPQVESMSQKFGKDIESGIRGMGE